MIRRVSQFSATKFGYSVRTSDSEQVLTGEQAKIGLFLKFFYVTLFLALASFGVPTRRAQAGIFSFVSEILSGSPVEAEVVNRANSQNMALLQAAVNTDPNPSKGAGDITIVQGTALLPDSGPLGAGGTVDKDLLGKIYTYEVREGDSLSDIAKMFDVTVNTIIWSNDLKGASIRPGQQLVILPVSGLKYVVKKGDTLKGIANRHKADIDDIKDFNNLSDNSVLAIGDEIIIPDGEIDNTQSSSGSTSVKSTIKSYPTIEGYFRRPIAGGSKTQGIHGYNGVDLASSYGTSILAAASGQVIVSKAAGWNGGYGKYIVISHPNGTQTLYSHLSENSVSVGDYVKQGQIIGLMGNSGKVSGPTGVHLHFEVRGARNPF